MSKSKKKSSSKKSSSKSSLKSIKVSKKDNLVFDSKHEFCCLIGRILKGKTSKDFKTLNKYNSQRKTVFIISSLQLKKMIDKSGYQILIDIGYPKDYIQNVKKNKEKFRLILISKEEADNKLKMKLATWDNVIDLMKIVYPDISDRLERHRNGLKNTPYKKIIKMNNGKDFKDVKGPDDPKFMTYQKYLNSEDTLVNTRAFLFHTEGLNNLYKGDGFTYNEKGEKGIKEYITKDIEVKKLKNYKYLDLKINIPKTHIIENLLEKKKKVKSKSKKSKSKKSKKSKKKLKIKK